MVAVVRMPRRCAVSITSSHSDVEPLAMPMIRRTRSDRISAPPPGIESSPAAISRRSASSRESFDTLAMCCTSAGERPWIQIG